MRKKIIIIIFLIILLIEFLYYITEINKSKPYTVVYNNLDKNVPNFVWLYWENKPDSTTPNYISLCRESVIKNCSKELNVIILTTYNIRKYLPNLRSDINQLSLPQKVDYIRLYILQKYGGIYLDSDIILFKTPNYLLNLLRNYDFIGFGSNSILHRYKHITYGKISNWAMCSRKNGILVSKCLDEANRILNSSVNIDYHTLGRELLWNQINFLQKRNNYEYYHFPSINLERDLNGYKLTNKRFESNENLDNNYDPYFTILYNTAPGFSENFLKKSKKELLNSNMLVSQLFRKALL